MLGSTGPELQKAGTEGFYATLGALSLWEFRDLDDLDARLILELEELSAAVVLTTIRFRCYTDLMKSINRNLDDLVTRFTRIVELFNRLDSRPYEFGEGERLFRSELHALQAVGKGEGRTVTELGVAFGTTKGAVSQIVGKLEAKGYLVKERNPGYSKELLLSLSDRGKVAFKAHEALHRRIDRELLAALEPVSREELARFDDLLGRVERFMRGIAE